MNSAVLTSGISVENNVLKNTFMLLAASFAFSAAMAMVAIMISMPMINPWVMIGVYIGILVLLHMNKNNGIGVLMCFALTGWLGLTLGPVLSVMLAVKSAVVIGAFSMATAMFIGLSAYALISRRDFSFMGGFLTAGILVAFIAGLIALFFEITALSLVVSAAFVILSGGMILWQVGEIVNGGETNYVIATVTLFASFYNIFVSLMNLFSSSD